MKKNYSLFVSLLILIFIFSQGMIFGMDWRERKLEVSKWINLKEDEENFDVITSYYNITDQNAIEFLKAIWNRDQNEIDNYLADISMQDKVAENKNLQKTIAVIDVLRSESRIAGDITEWIYEIIRNRSISNYARKKIEDSHLSLNNDQTNFLLALAINDPHEIDQLYFHDTEFVSTLDANLIELAREILDYSDKGTGTNYYRRTFDTLFADALRRLSTKDQAERHAKHFGITDQKAIEFLEAIAKGDMSSIKSEYLETDFADDYLSDENLLTAAITLLRESQKEYFAQDFKYLFGLFKYLIESKRRQDHVDRKIEGYNFSNDQVTFLREISHGGLEFDEFKAKFLDDDNFMDTLDRDAIRLAKEIAQIYKKNFKILNNYHYLLHKLNLRQTVLEGEGKVAPSA